MIELITARIGFLILADTVIYQLNRFQNGLLLGLVDTQGVLPSAYVHLGYNLFHSSTVNKCQTTIDFPDVVVNPELEVFGVLIFTSNRLRHS
jgi:hypothetical protein